MGTGFMSGWITMVATSVPVLIVAGVLIAIANRRRRAAQSAAQDWLRTEGRILAAGVESYLSTQRHSTGTTSRVTMYRPVVSYQYRAAGRTFTGNRLALGLPLGFGSPAVAQRQVAKYQVGASVPVYYNPANAEEAALELRAQGTKLLSSIAIMMLVILALTVALVAGMLWFVSDMIGGMMP